MQNTYRPKIKDSFKKTLRAFGQFLPVVFGVLLLLAMIDAVVPKTFYAWVFSGNKLIDPLIGAMLGGIFAGSPVASYVFGGEFLAQGVSLVAVAAFILAWVTVGVVQLPAESLMLGKKFALARNGISFLMSIMIAILTVVTLSFL